MGRRIGSIEHVSNPVWVEITCSLVITEVMRSLAMEYKSGQLLYSQTEDRRQNRLDPS